MPQSKNPAYAAAARSFNVIYNRYFFPFSAVKRNVQPKP